MAAREVVFLGTSSQVPTRDRGHNAFFVRWDELGILFDPGEGKPVERLTVSRYGLGGLSKPVWNPDR